ncbi:MAG: hypothetical protein QNJ37_14035, partial [Crocosphaera sp.]|nr:hypothetical protein [Crocosphaera sp.]
MIISDMAYLETVEANEVKGGFLTFFPVPPSTQSYSDADATSFGRAAAQTLTFTDSNTSADIGLKNADATSQS